jgi:hypothetical protein
LSDDVKIYCPFIGKRLPTLERQQDSWSRDMVSDTRWCIVRGEYMLMPMPSLGFLLPACHLARPNRERGREPLVPPGPSRAVVYAAKHFQVFLSKSLVPKVLKELHD